MTSFIPLSVPNLKGNELAYITEAVETEWVSTGGPFVDAFEEKVASYVHAAGAVSCQNGTAGLHVALQVCGVERGDEVLVPTLTFIAAVNPVTYLGATPVFMDCDDSLCLDPEKLDQFCSEMCTVVDGKLINKQTQKQVKAVVIVHVFGNMAKMALIMAIAEKYGVKVIEDATEALGSFYQAGPFTGRYAGTIGHMGVYSFNGNKIMTTGGGGMIVSNDRSFLARAKHLTTQAKSDDVYYTHDEIGYNYRMTNIQAAMGLGQLEQLETFIETKNNRYQQYRHAFTGSEDLTLLPFDEEVRPNYWFYALQLSDTFPLSRNELIHHLAQQRIQVRPIWGLIHEQLPYQSHQQYRIEKAYTYLNSVINIPCSSNLTPEQVERVVRTLMLVRKEEVK